MQFGRRRGARSQSQPVLGPSSALRRRALWRCLCPGRGAAGDRRLWWGMEGPVRPVVLPAAFLSAASAELPSRRSCWGLPVGSRFRLGRGGCLPRPSRGLILQQLLRGHSGCGRAPGLDCFAEECFVLLVFEGGGDNASCSAFSACLQVFLCGDEDCQLTLKTCWGGFGGTWCLQM